MKHDKSTFSRRKRTMEVSEVKLVDLARMPGPTHYLNPLKQARGDTAFHFGQAARKTGFEVPNHINPGPGDYGSTRMFDNKVVVDYSKRGGAYATASGFNINTSSLGKKTEKHTRLHSPTTAETKRINMILDGQLASTKNTGGKKRREYAHSTAEKHHTTQNSFGHRKGTLHALGTPGSSHAPLPSEYIYSQDPIQIQVIKRKKDKKNRKKMIE